MHSAGSDQSEASEGEGVKVRFDSKARDRWRAWLSRGMYSGNPLHHDAESAAAHLRENGWTVELGDDGWWLVTGNGNETSECERHQRVLTLDSSIREVLKDGDTSRALFLMRVAASDLASNDPDEFLAHANSGAKQRFSGKRGSEIAKMERERQGKPTHNEISDAVKAARENGAETLTAARREVARNLGVSLRTVETATTTGRRRGRPPK